jgi:ubiquinone/menaquinone biosynthesis C-methylase UbiE
MSYGWIDATKFSFNTFLLFDRYIVRSIARNKNPEFNPKLAIALSGNPAVFWYLVNKCPECAEHFRRLLETAPVNCSPEEIRDCEVFVLNELDWAVVYVYPELMEELRYIKDWDKQRLLSITDFTGKTVLDIGAGTGRLAFAAAPLAKYVYASEPVDKLREYMREKLQRLNLRNVYVIDGTVESIPFPDESFDIVMSGHVFGDNYKAEWLEMNRVTKHRGWVIDCQGDDRYKHPEGPKKEMLQLGFEYAHHVSKTGGDIYRYWQQKK